jgi:hypothetical protein
MLRVTKVPPSTSTAAADYYPTDDGSMQPNPDIIFKYWVFSKTLTFVRNTVSTTKSYSVEQCNVITNLSKKIHY